MGSFKCWTIQALSTNASGWAYSLALIVLILLFVCRFDLYSIRDGAAFLPVAPVAPVIKTFFIISFGYGCPCSIALTAWSVVKTAWKEAFLQSLTIRSVS